MKITKTELRKMIKETLLNEDVSLYDKFGIEIDNVESVLKNMNGTVLSSAQFNKAMKMLNELYKYITNI